MKNGGDVVVDFRICTGRKGGEPEPVGCSCGDTKCCHDYCGCRSSTRRLKSNPVLLVAYGF